MISASLCYNACIRYDKSLQQKPSPTARAVYWHELDGDSRTDSEDGDYVEERFTSDGIDTPSDGFYNINTTNFNRTLCWKTSTHDWADLLLFRSVQLLCFLLVKELLLCMYLSQLMSTFTNYLKVYHSLNGFFIQ